jgi:colanic acid biosynthesis protein WcaH
MKVPTPNSLYHHYINCVNNTLTHWEKKGQMPPKNKLPRFIPTKLYNQISKCMPIPSVEAIINIEGALLFLHRNNTPAKGEWWFPGGRIHMGESLEETLKREVKEETGLEITSHKLVNVYSRVFEERHDIAIVYACTCKKDKVTLNDEHSDYLLSAKPPEKLHPYILQVIKDTQAKTNST